jgi:hypothetical protein
MRSKIGEIVRVLNKTKKTNASQHYNAIWTDDKGRPTPLLITDVELIDLKERANRNKGDLPLLDIPIPEPPGIFRRLFGGFRR